MIPFSPPYISEKVVAEVVDSLNSGWITTGPKVKLLEEEISNYLDIPNVLCVNSWTSGAIMILRWLGLQEGDEVIIPAYTYSATALAVMHAGGTPVMVDSGDDFNMDMGKVQQAITKRTKAIIPVDFAGYPCDYERLNHIITKKEVVDLFEPTSEVQKTLGRILNLSDAAHSLGGIFGHKAVGHKADISIFSLHAVKNITTAEGGAIAINMPAPFSNDGLYDSLRMMTLNCQTKDAFSKSQGGQWRYDITGLGMKINLPDVNAAIGLAQIREYSQLLKRRKEIFQQYLNRFSKMDWAIVPPMEADGIVSSCHLFALRIKDIKEDQRDRMIDEITKLGVSVNVHFIPLPLLSYFKTLGYSINDYPTAHKNYISEISLPIYPQLTDDQVELILDSVCTSYKNVTRSLSKIAG
ncbi:DegT/DnrJ/EryC1/StrS family aminotransferase [Flavobacteriaceae bacterium TP-CH-4]|uniref:DegT/DnrJ/EryC1/StrS family aminotransferase n=1 Tax=Pelagihabitans pacificus TaxID=2696054 RepID=A0A967AWA9_9FLAO|nr:DegT/DnrJ/EryC1/StrS family aminotransferase [Pelagihabitans pacificus]NHF61089.1 DegT/DnrJ/EryC1/StrS family aminotransferase [Pelagihabitans pacificus]